jgi:thiamine-phosphate pyrophosphorylase
VSLHLPRQPLIYLITSRHSHKVSAAASERDCRAAQLAAIAVAARAGCQLIQIRERDLTARELGEFVRAAISVARPHGARVLVNDRPDVALGAGADGVHLRTSSLPAREVRNLRQARNLLIGVSTHTLREAAEAEKGGADFIVFGPVFAPLSKPATGLLPGLTGLAGVCRQTRIPVIGLGGIEMSNFSEVLRHGAAGIAGISLFTDLKNLPNRVAQILSHAQSRLPD